MNNIRFHHKWGYLLSTIMIIILSGSLTGCADSHTFSSRIKQMDFTFEYPRGWRVAIIEQYSELVYANLVGPDTSENESGAKATFHVYLGKGDQADQEAQRISKGSVSVNDTSRNFNIIRQETVNIDGYKGYLAEYDFDHVSLPTGPSTWFYISTHVLDITVPRNGKVYEIWMSASQNEWNAREQDFQQILDTFKWK